MIFRNQGCIRNIVFHYITYTNMVYLELTYLLLTCSIYIVSCTVRCVAFLAVFTAPHLQEPHLEGEKLLHAVQVGFDQVGR